MRKSIFTFILIFAVIVSAFSLNAFAVEMTDGTYEVNITLWHSEDDKESMAADAIGKKATIVVENGVKTMHITSGEMSMMGIKASLQELRIADTKGNFTDAKVESKNSEGNPTGFYFTMPHTNEYIMVKVNPHLAIMGNKDIGARIKVNYSTLKLVKAAETTAVSEAETTLIQSVDENGETVTEILTVKAAEETATQAVTEAETVETTVNTETSEQPDGNNSTAIIIAAVLAALVVIIVIIKKRKK